MTKAYYNGPLRRQEGTPAGQGGERRYNQNTVDQYASAVDEVVNGRFETLEEKNAAEQKMNMLAKELPPSVAKRIRTEAIKNRRGTGDLSYNDTRKGV